MTKKHLDFTIFCIESIAEHLNQNGAELYAKLTNNSSLLDEYIIQHYDTLHSQGKEYIVQDILDVMHKEGLAL